MAGWRPIHTPPEPGQIVLAAYEHEGKRGVLLLPWTEDIDIEASLLYAWRLAPPPPRPSRYDPDKEPRPPRKPRRRRRRKRRPTAEQIRKAYFRQPPAEAPSR